MERVNANRTSRIAVWKGHYRLFPCLFSVLESDGAEVAMGERKREIERERDPMGKRERGCSERERG